MVPFWDPCWTQNSFQTEFGEPLTRDNVTNIILNSFFYFFLNLLSQMAPVIRNLEKLLDQVFPQTPFPGSSQAHHRNSQRHPYGIGRFPSSADWWTRQNPIPSSPQTPLLIPDFILGKTFTAESAPRHPPAPQGALGVRQITFCKLLKTQLQTFASAAICFLLICHRASFSFFSIFVLLFLWL